MTPFKVGDRVERIGPLAPDWMKYGVITKVLPDKHGIDWATPERIASRDRLCQPEIDLFKQLRCGFPVTIEFG